MFNLLISADLNAWENAQLMSVPVERFKEYSGEESASISPQEPATLHRLEEVPALLMHEWGAEGISADIVRYGFVQNVKVVKRAIHFGLHCEAHCQRGLIDEFAHHLGLGDWERSRTHWAI